MDFMLIVSIAKVVLTRFWILCCVFFERAGVLDYPLKFIVYYVQRVGGCLMDLCLFCLFIGKICEWLSARCLHEGWRDLLRCLAKMNLGLSEFSRGCLRVIIRTVKALGVFVNGGWEEGREGLSEVFKNAFSDDMFKNFQDSFNGDSEAHGMIIWLRFLLVLSLVLLGLALHWVPIERVAIIATAPKQLTPLEFDNLRNSIRYKFVEHSMRSSEIESQYEGIARRLKVMEAKQRELLKAFRLMREEMKAGILDAPHGRKRIAAKKEAAFIKLEQTNKTVKVYEAEFAKLSTYAPDMVNTEKKRKSLFIQGLRIEIKTALAACNLPTYSTAVKIAQRIEHAQATLSAFQNHKEEITLRATGGQNMAIGAMSRYEDEAYLIAKLAGACWDPPDTLPNDDADTLPNHDAAAI